MFEFISLTLSIALGIVLAMVIMVVIAFNPMVVKWYAKVMTKNMSNIIENINDVTGDQ